MVGHARETLQRWRTLAGAPTTPDPAAWTRFIAERNLGGGSRISSEREQLLCARLRETVALATARRRKESGSVVDASAVDAFLRHLGGSVRAAIYTELLNELPGKLAGRPPGEVRAVMRDTADGIVHRMRAAHEQFQTEHPRQCVLVDGLSIEALAAIIPEKGLALKVVRTLRDRNLLAFYENTVEDDTEAAPQPPANQSGLPGD